MSKFLKKNFTIDAIEENGDIRCTIESNGGKYLQWYRNINDINHASELGKLSGKNMTKKERSKRASNAGKARWNKIK